MPLARTTAIFNLLGMALTVYHAPCRTTTLNARIALYHHGGQTQHAVALTQLRPDGLFKFSTAMRIGLEFGADMSVVAHDLAPPAMVANRSFPLLGTSSTRTADFGLSRPGPWRGLLWSLAQRTAVVRGSYRR